MYNSSFIENLVEVSTLNKTANTKQTSKQANVGEQLSITIASL